MNNKIIEFSTEKGNWVAVEVPEGSNSFFISVDSNGRYLNFQYDDDGYDLGGELKLTENTYLKLKILGKATELTDEQAAEIVTQMKDSSYPFEVELYLDTLASLMQSIGCDPNEEHVILRRV